MRRLGLLLLCVLAGCSLDLARLRGGGDGGLDVPDDVPGLDAPFTDAPAHDAPDDVDGGVEGGVPQIVDSRDFDDPPMWVAAAAHPSGVRVAVVVPDAGEIHSFVASGTGCGIRFGKPFSSGMDWLGAPALGHVSDDSFPDIVAQSDTGAISVVTDTGGTLTVGTEITFPGVARFAAVAVGSLDGDDLDDFLAVERGPGVFLLTQASGALDADPALSTAGRTYVDGAVGQLDGINDDDLAMIATTSDDGLVFEARLASGGGSFPSRTGVIGDYPTGSLAIGPPSGGRQQMFALAGDDLFVGQIVGMDIVVSGPFRAGVNLRDLVVANVVGDATLEVVISSGGPALLVVELTVSGITPVTEIPLSAAGPPTALAAADVDGDGLAEIFVLTGNELSVVTPGCTVAP